MTFKIGDIVEYDETKQGNLGPHRRLGHKKRYKVLEIITEYTSFGLSKMIQVAPMIPDSAFDMKERFYIQRFIKVNRRNRNLPSWF